MVLYNNWEDMLKTVCKKHGWEDGKNCRISYKANAIVEEDKITYTATILPFNDIEELTIDIEVE